VLLLFSSEQDNYKAKLSFLLHCLFETIDYSNISLLL